MNCRSDIYHCVGFIDMNDKGEQQNKTSFQWGLLKVAQISNQGYIFICICSILIQLNINHKQFEAENTNVMASKKAKLLPKHGSGIRFLLSFNRVNFHHFVIAP